MTGFLLVFYVLESQKHHGQPVWELLLTHANETEVAGGSAFKAMAGFGRHRVLHENRFLELGGTQTVAVEFMVREEESKQLLEWVAQQGIQLLYARMPALFEAINADLNPV